MPGFGQKMEPELQNWCSSKGGELGEYEGSGRKFSAFFSRDPCIYSAPNTTALCSRYVHLTLECCAVLRSICCIMQLVLLCCYSLQWHWQWWMASAFTKQSSSLPIFITISTFFSQVLWNLVCHSDIAPCYDHLQWVGIGKT